MDTPASPPHPWQPGELRVVASPAWGHARLADPVGHVITILSSHHLEATAAAYALAGHAALVAERDRYRAALGLIERSDKVLAATLRSIARDATKGGAAC